MEIKTPTFESLGKTSPIVYSLILGAGLMAYGLNTEKNWTKERQEYNQLYNQAVECVEQDGNPGLSSQAEINELYRRAGVSPIDVNSFSKAISLVFSSDESPRVDFPALKKQNLETIAQSCRKEK